MADPLVELLEGIKRTQSDPDFKGPTNMSLTRMMEATEKTVSVLVDELYAQKRGFEKGGVYANYIHAAREMLISVQEEADKAAERWEYARQALRVPDRFPEDTPEPSAPPLSDIVALLRGGREERRQRRRENGPQGSPEAEEGLEGRAHRPSTKQTNQG